MKKLILQTYYEGPHTTMDPKTGCYIPCMELSIESEKRFKTYANSIGADYKMYRTPPPMLPTENAGWARFAILWEDKYDEVCYADADILPSNRCLGVSIFNTPGVGKLTERDEGSRHSWHVNAGVFRLTALEAKKMKWRINDKKYLKWLEKTGKNQDPFNECYKQAMGRKPLPMDPVWNMTRPYHRPGYFAHYIGAQKTEKGNQFGSMFNCPIYKEVW